MDSLRTWAEGVVLFIQGSCHLGVVTIDQLEWAGALEAMMKRENLVEVNLLCRILEEVENSIDKLRWTFDNSDQDAIFQTKLGFDRIKNDATYLIPLTPNVYEAIMGALQLRKRTVKNDLIVLGIEP